MCLSSFLCLSLALTRFRSSIFIKYILFVQRYVLHVYSHTRTHTHPQVCFFRFFFSISFSFSFWLFIVSPIVDKVFRLKSHAKSTLVRQYLSQSVSNQILSAVMFLMQYFPCLSSCFLLFFFCFTYAYRLVDMYIHGESMK